jgi:hypothetical protein
VTESIENLPKVLCYASEMSISILGNSNFNIEFKVGLRNIKGFSEEQNFSGELYITSPMISEREP